MPSPGPSPLTRAVEDALDAKTRGTPTAELARVYAERIDEATHVPLALDKALRTVRGACMASADAYRALDALDKIAAALSAVTVAGDLGPKLLAALDALLLTPKAQAALERKLPGDGKPANPLEGLRAQQDELQARRERRPAG